LSRFDDFWIEVVIFLAIVAFRWFWEWSKKSGATYQPTNEPSRALRDEGPKPTFVADPVARFACARCGELVDARTTVVVDGHGRLCEPCQEATKPDELETYRG
jgi:hypothetical protein